MRLHHSKLKTSLVIRNPAVKAHNKTTDDHSPEVQNGGCTARWECRVTPSLTPVTHTTAWLQASIGRDPRLLGTQEGADGVECFPTHAGS